MHVVIHRARSRFLCVAVAAVSVLVSSPAARAEGTIAIGSKSFPESRLLGEIMATLIEENTTLTVRRQLGLGGTHICFAALNNGEIDAYAEYTGTGLINILNEPLDADNDSYRIFQRVRDGFRERYRLTWLEPFGFSNSYALAVRRDLGVAKVSQLAARRRDVVAGFHHEFIIRQDGYAGLVKHYGFHLDHVRGLEHGLAYLALENHQIDVMDAYTTDGVLHKFDFVLLEDDKHFFPPYDAAPVVRSATLAEHPEIGQWLGRLAGRLPRERMVELNYQVAVEGRDFVEVARKFLVDEGLIAASGEVLQPGPFAELARLTLQHLLLVIAATGAATVLGIALGLLVARYPNQLAGPVIGTTGVIQTVPSLALLGFMIPLLGIGALPAIVALFLYGLLPIIRNTFTGVSSVPGDLKEAGTAMGMTRRQLLFGLELPLATRTIMAGVRTALVINIGTATLAAFIGAGGLGEPITRGLQQGDQTQILWGAIPAAILALSCDFLMARLENLLEPRGLKLTRRRIA